MNEELKKTQIELGKAVEMIAELKKEYEDLEYWNSINLQKFQTTEQDLLKLQSYVMDRGYVDSEYLFFLQSSVPKAHRFFPKVIEGMRNEIWLAKGAKELLGMINGRNKNEENEETKQTTGAN